MATSKATTAAEPVKMEEFNPLAAETGGGALSLLEMEPGAALDQARAKIEAHTEIVGMLLQHKVGQDCWIDQGGKPYLEGRGARAALQFLGLSQRNLTYEWYDERDAEGSTGQALRCSFDLVNAAGDVIWNGDGSRSFDRIVDSVHDVRKAAEKNAWHHAGNDVLGIGGWSWDQLGKYGIERGQSITFDAGSKGGKGGRNKDGALTMPFGRDKGVPVADAQEDNLRWMHARLLGDLDKPDNAKWRARNVQLLEAIDRALLDRGLEPAVGAPAATTEMTEEEKAEIAQQEAEAGRR